MFSGSVYHHTVEDGDNYRATFSLTMNMGKLGEHPTCVCFAHHTSHLTLLRVEPETPWWGASQLPIPELYCGLYAIQFE